MKAYIIALLRRILFWLDPPPPPPAPDSALPLTRELIAQAAKFAEGTAPDYKRAWVFKHLVKAFPDRRQRELGWLIEEVIRIYGHPEDDQG